MGVVARLTSETEQRDDTRKITRQTHCPEHALGECAPVFDGDAVAVNGCREPRLALRVFGRRESRVPYLLSGIPLCGSLVRS